MVAGNDTVHRSRFSDVDVPVRAIADFVLADSSKRGERLAIVDPHTNRGLTYTDLQRDVVRLAAGLGRLGIGHGDVVAMMMENCVEFPLVFHGVTAAGAVVTTLNPAASVGEAASQFASSGARAVIATPAASETATKAAAAARVRHVIIGSDDDITQMSLRRLLIDARPGAVAIDAVNDIAALPYSSGTTGLAKGVMLTHTNLVSNVLQTSAVQQIGPGEAVAAVLPFFHIYGLNTIMNHVLWAGGTLVCMRRFVIEDFLAAIERYRISRVYAAPPIILALAKEPCVADADLSSVRSLFSGAAPLDPALAELCARRVGCRVTQGYGLTETSPATHLTPDDADDVPTGSVGFALPNTDCKIVDVASGRSVRVGEAGELWIRGPQVMLGYHKDPVATAATIDGDGFLHTGDVAKMDDCGHYFIVDRLKELIKVKGFQVPPAELEAILLTHDDVVDAAVIGLPDADAGEAPMAFVVVRRAVAAEELEEFVASRVAWYKRIRRIEFTDSIPKSPSGKILRRQLRDRMALEGPRT
jgi:acyl-CoA synthetase (AMP-forming)/AMP-acid ligase II